MSPTLLATAFSTALSLAAGLTFLAATIAFGDYDWVARIGGAVWISALCIIIIMPTVTPWIREGMNR